MTSREHANKQPHKHTNIQTHKAAAAVVPALEIQLVDRHGVGGFLLEWMPLLLLEGKRILSGTESWKRWEWGLSGDHVPPLGGFFEGGRTWAVC